MSYGTLEDTQDCKSMALARETVRAIAFSGGSNTNFSVSVNCFLFVKNSNLMGNAILCQCMHNPCERILGNI